MVRQSIGRLLRGIDLVIVQGDTSSALGGALAAFEAGIPVAHVEAGLRTFDPEAPWPEEEYRTAIDAGADILFAPTEISAANLRHERVTGLIHVTGNSGIDALLRTVQQLPSPKLRERACPQLLVTCHRRENWGERLENIATALTNIALEEGARIDVLLHPNPSVTAAVRRSLDGQPGIRLLEPCSHRELLMRMRDSDLVLSDSGGIQEEAPALGVPLLVLRDKTERPEGLASGNMKLVGTCAATVTATAKGLLADRAALAAMARPALPYGDGRAAPRIAAIVEQWLESRLAVRRSA